MGEIPNPKLVFLTGFAGSGKTTIGKLLARQLGWQFIDLDRRIERTAGKSVADMFATEGERIFRRYETAILKEVCSGSRRNSVVALGGGTLIVGKNRAMVQKSGCTVYLSCSQAELYRRLHRAQTRPLLKSATAWEVRRKIAVLLKARKKYYEICDVKVVVTNRTPTNIARELRKYVK